MTASAACNWNQRSARNTGCARVADQELPLRLAVAEGLSILVRLFIISAPAERFGSRPARA
ncbi:hypothetical protein D3C76_1605380 [compost metagenome]